MAINDDIKFIQTDFGYAHTAIKLDSEKIKINSAEGLEGNEVGLKQLVELYGDFRGILESYTKLLKDDLEHIRTAGENLKTQDNNSGDQFKK